MAPAPKRGQGSGRSVAFFVVIDFLLKTPFFQPGVGARKVELLCFRRTNSFRAPLDQCIALAIFGFAQHTPILASGIGESLPIFRRPHWRGNLHAPYVATGGAGMQVARRRRETALEVKALDHVAVAGLERDSLPGLLLKKAPGYLA